MSDNQVLRRSNEKKENFFEESKQALAHKSSFPSFKLFEW